jgi:hypothetical protein
MELPARFGVVVLCCWLLLETDALTRSEPCTIINKVDRLSLPPTASILIQPRTGSRRLLLQTVASLLPVVSVPESSKAEHSVSSLPIDETETLTVPLYWKPQLNAYVIYYSIHGDRFGAILDTGSPFLTIPNYCDVSRWGCYRPESSIPSGLPPTMERFDNAEGRVEWRSAPFSFVNATGSMMGPSLITFGVLSDSLMAGPGGVFFGLVRDREDWIRPSFLGQTNVRSFVIDLLSPQKTLTLTTSALNKERAHAIPLVKDLHKRYHDPTVHYTARAKTVLVNGRPLGKHDGKTIYVIFDTGVTGMAVSQELYDESYQSARQMREKSQWGQVEVAFRTLGGNVKTLSAVKPLTTPLRMTWNGFNSHLIVLGLSFLDNSKIAIDIDAQKLWIDQ